MPYLIIQTGKHRGRKLRINPGHDFLIGRDGDCQLRLASTDVSRQHCVIRADKSGMTVTDLGSRNGTFVDGFLIESTFPLKPGSILQVGPMQFSIPGVKAASAPAEIEEAASDYDIASWLTEEGETKDANVGDSTIIPTFTPKPEKQSSSNPLSAHPHAEAAAAIIQRYWKSRQSANP